MDSTSKPSSSKRSAEAKGNVVKRQKLWDERPLIFQLFPSQLSDHRRLPPVKLDDSSSPSLNQTSPRQHSWVLFGEGLPVQRFTPDGRLVYIFQENWLIIVDLLLNTHAVLKEPAESTWLTGDVVVLNSTTLLCSGLSNHTNCQLQLIRLFVEERRFERRVLHTWSNAWVNIVITNITGGSTDKSSALLQGRCSWQIGRLDLDKLEFTLDSTSAPFSNSLTSASDWSEDGRYLRQFNYEAELQVFDLKTQKKSCRKLPEFVLPEDPSHRYSSLTTKSLYVSRKMSKDNEATKWSFWRLDLETDKWAKLPFETTNDPIGPIMPIVDEQGVVIGTQLSRSETSNPFFRHCSAHRVMFGAPESLVKLSWFKAQEYFSQYEGPNNFNQLRKKKPYSTIFPDVYKSLEPIRKYRL